MCICGVISMFINLRPCYVVVTCANNDSMVCEQMGTLVISHNNNMIAIEDCLYIPRCMTLISVYQLTKMGLHVLLYSTGMRAYKSMTDVRADKPFIQTEKRIDDKMWTLPIKGVSSYKSGETVDQVAKSERSFTALQDSTFGEWSASVLHEAHMHAPLKVLQKLYPHLKNVEKLPPCDACLSQSLRQPYTKKSDYSDDFIKKSKLKKINFTSTKIDGDLVDPIDFSGDGMFAATHTDTAPNDPNIEVTTADMGLVADADVPNFRFGRYLHSDTKVVKTESCSA